MISVVLPVLAPTPFLRAMTWFAVQALRTNADSQFELIVCEAADDYFDPAHWSGDEMRIDKYLNFTPPIGGVREINAGVDAASGDYIVFTGNDIIAPPHWDTELLRPFNERTDCGASTLAATEPGVFIGPTAPIDITVEGMYSPFTMFRKGWRYDEAFLRVYQDSDLIMRMYEKGLRAYRNCRAIVHHFGSMTNNNVNTAEHGRQLAKDEALFYQRWGKSPLAMFAMIRFGQQTYGREYEGWTQPIHRHT